MTLTPWLLLFASGIGLTLFWLVTQRVVERFLRASHTPQSPYTMVARWGFFALPSTEGFLAHYFRVRVRNEAAFLALIKSGMAGKSLPGAWVWLWLHAAYLPLFLLLLTILILWTPHTPSRQLAPAAQESHPLRSN